MSEAPLALVVRPNRAPHACCSGNCPGCGAAGLGLPCWEGTRPDQPDCGLLSHTDLVKGVAQR